MLEARNISVTYGARMALRDVSLGASPGTVTAILGPNGAGKSTLMRALNGGIEIQSGEVSLDAVPISKLSRNSIAKRVGVVAQETESILLLDEPTANLDLAHQASMLQVVSARCRDYQSSALIVTHDINLAAEFADKILLLKGGMKAAFGSPDEVLTEEVLREVFEIRVIVDRHPVSGAPRVTPVHEARR